MKHRTQQVPVLPPLRAELCHSCLKGGFACKALDCSCDRESETMIPVFDKRADVYRVVAGTRSARPWKGQREVRDEQIRGCESRSRVPLRSLKLVRAHKRA